MIWKGIYFHFLLMSLPTHAEATFQQKDVAHTTWGYYHAIQLDMIVMVMEDTHVATENICVMMGT